MSEKAIKNSELENVMEEIGIGRYQYLLLACCYWACALTAMMPILVTILILEYPSITSLQITLLGCSWSTGYLIGCSSFPLIVYRRGRAQPFKWSIVLIAIGSVGIAISGNLYVIYVGYFIIGLGTGGDNIIYSGYLLENLPPSKIRYLTLQGMVWGIGSASMLGLALICNVIFPDSHDNWRITIGIIGIVNLLFCFLRRKLLDSPTHLYAIKDSRLIEVLEQIITINKISIPDLRNRLLGDMQQDLQISPIDDDEIQSPVTAYRTSVSISVIFKKPYIYCTVQFLVMYSLLNYCNTGFYIVLPELMPTSSLVGTYVIMIIQQLCTIPGLFLSSWCVSTKLGRKYTSMLMWSLTGGSFIGLIFASNLGVVMLCLSCDLMFMNGGYASLGVHFAEVWSAEVRFIGVGFVMSASKLAGVAAPIVVTSMMNAEGSFLILLTFGIFYFIVAMMILPIPETRRDSFQKREIRKRKTAADEEIEEIESV